MTRSHLEDLRNVVKTSDHPYVAAQNAIRDKYRCKDYGSNTFCYLLKHPEPLKPAVHVDLTPTFIDLWAGQIKEKKATLTQPPRDIEEIDKALNAALLRPSTRGRPVQASTARTQNHHDGYAPVIHYNITGPSSSNERVPSALLSTPPRVQATSAVFSPVPGYCAKDFTKDALKAYLSYLADKYEDPRYAEAYPRLQESDIGVDLLSEPDMVNTIRDICDISHGVAMRIVKEYSGWKQYLKNVRSIYTLILQCRN